MPVVTEALAGSIWRDATGRIRSGWVVGVFTAVALASAPTLHGAVYLAGLSPDSPYSLDDPKLLFQCLANLGSALLATSVARAMGQDVGLERPRLAVPGAVAAGALLCVTVGLGALVSGSLG